MKSSFTGRLALPESFPVSVALAVKSNVSSQRASTKSVTTIIDKVTWHWSRIWSYLLSLTGRPVALLENVPVPTRTDSVDSGDQAKSISGEDIAEGEVLATIDQGGGLGAGSIKNMGRLEGQFLYIETLVSLKTLVGTKDKETRKPKRLN